MSTDRFADAMHDAFAATCQQIRQAATEHDTRQARAHQAWKDTATAWHNVSDAMRDMATRRAATTRRATPYLLAALLTLAPLLLLAVR
jgi:hypothetical protein